MRLIKAEISGIGRLAKTSINLDSRVIAVVGPNEAGKSTLLAALTRISTGADVAPAGRSRGVSVRDGDAVVTASFILDKQDLEAIESISLEAVPQSVVVTRRIDGGTATFGIQPRPRRDLQQLGEALEVSSAFIDRGNLLGIVNPDSLFAQPEAEPARNINAELQEVVDLGLRLMAGGTSGDTLDRLNVLSTDVAEAVSENVAAMDLRGALDVVKEFAENFDPEPLARETLWARVPKVLLFSEADRILASVNQLEEKENDAYPPALRNLANAAGLDLLSLFRTIQSGDQSRKDTMVLGANLQLEKVFSEAWRQSPVSAYLHVEGNLLRVSILEQGKRVSVFDERSAGLKTFVALTNFLYVHNGQDLRPIVLIDEAENHLHIDAQADLVNMFMGQSLAQKIVYTTHSPACLPPDLGTGVRAVVPRLDGSEISDVVNNFWAAAAGFSPLMLAMGASAAAFTPTRRAVIAEGPSEMILLPTILRLATGVADLGYQIAPGLSSVPNDLLPTLDFEAAKVAFLVDGDKGGKALRSRLLRSGVPADLVKSLGFPGVENALSSAAYLRAVAALLRECNPGAVVPTLPLLVDAKSASWAKQMTDWANSEQLLMPSKVAVANWLISNDAVEVGDAAANLTELHSSLRRTLGYRH